MAKQDDFVKTALRIPRSLHAQIQDAATASGRSMNAEIIDRLQGEIEDGSLMAIVNRLKLSDEELLEATKKQRDLLWNITDRTEEVLKSLDEFLEPPVHLDKAASARDAIASLRDLIRTIKAYR
jgi:hypothetical protein